MKKIAAREKKLIATALAALVLFLLIQFALSPLLGYYERLRNETPAMRRDLVTARRCAARFAALDREVKGIHAKLAQRKKEFNPYVSLSDIARRQGLSTEGIQMEKKPVDEELQEETAKVTLRKASLEKLVGYLYDIETSADLMTVKVLSVNTDSNDSLLLDATLDASTITRAEKREGTVVKKAPAKKSRGRKR